MSGIAAIEVGGTKVVVTVGTGPDNIQEPVILKTTSPAETISDVCATLRRFQAQGVEFSAIGIASFGPIDLGADSPTYGRFRGTPKLGWSGVDLLGPLRAAFGVPVAIETDVNGAALAEGAWGAARGLRTYAYVTIGTGVGLGLVVNGAPVHGMMHPEAGHILIRRWPSDDFEGSCPYHNDCLEGLISGAALRERLNGGAPEQLTAEDPIWDVVGDYLGQALAAISLVASPERIVVGGGVGLRPEMLKAARVGISQALAGFLEPLEAGVDDYVVAPELGAISGLFGAILVGANA